MIGPYRENILETSEDTALFERIPELADLFLVSRLVNQMVSTYDRRSQLIIITGSVLLLASIVSILVVRSNLSIKFYHPTMSLSWNLFVMQGNS